MPMSGWCDRLRLGGTVRGGAGKSQRPSDASADDPVTPAAALRIQLESIF